MKVFTCSDFKGHWPVGTAAVIVAETRTDAQRQLFDELRKLGLADKQEGQPTLVEVTLKRPKAIILCDGDY